MAQIGRPTTLLSDEPTVELIIKARRGDAGALDAILERCLPPLKRWAHGRLPAASRGHLSTDDLVQEAALHAIEKLDTFESRHVGAMQAYLRTSVRNRINDEVRRLQRRGIPVELPEDLVSDEPSAEEIALKKAKYEQYRAALAQLRTKDRELVIARVEMEWPIVKIAERFGFASPDAARMAVTRAIGRLMAVLEPEG